MQRRVQQHRMQRVVFDRLAEVGWQGNATVDRIAHPPSFAQSLKSRPVLQAKLGQARIEIPQLDASCVRWRPSHERRVHAGSHTIGRQGALNMCGPWLVFVLIRSAMQTQKPAPLGIRCIHVKQEAHAASLRQRQRRRQGQLSDPGAPRGSHRSENHLQQAGTR